MKMIIEKRRLTKHIFNELIGKEFEKTNGKVILASSTVEIVRIPIVNINEKGITQTGNDNY